MARRLTDEQWNKLQPLIPAPKRRDDGRGRPWRESREVLDGIFWILRTGAPWQDIPKEFPPYQTCHRRFQQWVRSGVFKMLLRILAEDLKERGGLDLSECFIDGTFVTAKKGGSAWEKLSVGRAANSWRSRTAMVFLSPYAQRVLARRK